MNSVRCSSIGNKRKKHLCLAWKLEGWQRGMQRAQITLFFYYSSAIVVPSLSFSRCFIIPLICRCSHPQVGTTDWNPTYSCWSGLQIDVSTFSLPSPQCCCCFGLALISQRVCPPVSLFPASASLCCFDSRWHIGEATCVTVVKVLLHAWPATTSSFETLDCDYEEKSCHSNLSHCLVGTGMGRWCLLTMIQFYTLDLQHYL